MQRSTAGERRTSAACRRATVASLWSSGLLAVALNGGCERAHVEGPAPGPLAETATKAAPDELAPDGAKCAQGDGGACARAALRRQHGDRARLDVAEALSLHRRACDLGYARSCVHAATWTLRQRRYSDETASALAAVRAGCQDGLPTACIFLLQLKQGTIVFREVLRDASISVDAQALVSACAGGDDDACAAGLETIEVCGALEPWACKVMDLRPSREKALNGGIMDEGARPFTEALRERCGEDRPRPCALLAAWGPAGDAERLHMDACAWGYAPSCLIRADALTGEEKAVEREALLKRACDAGLQRGCSGLLHEEIRRAGETVEGLRDGCELGDAALCTAYARATGTSGGSDKARALYERACDLGDAEGCDAAGLLDMPASIEDDAELVGRKGWFHRACALRGAPSCERVEALDRDRALGAELTACRAGQVERCDLAVEALAKHDPKAASELVGVVLKQSGQACRSSSEACAAIRGIHLITGCGEYGVQRCESRTATQMRQRRKARAFDARYHRLLLAECDRGVASSCQTLGGIVTESSPERAEKLFFRACELGDASSCGQVRSVGSDYRDVSEEEIYKYLQMACTGGDHVSCVGVSKYWSARDPRLSESLRTRARELLEQGCPVGQLRGSWCSTEPILESLAELGMYAVVVDALRRSCHGTHNWPSCRSLVNVLRAPRDSWT